MKVAFECISNGDNLTMSTTSKSKVTLSRDLISPTVEAVVLNAISGVLAQAYTAYNAGVGTERL